MAKDRGDIAADTLSAEEDIEKVVEREMAAAKENATAAGKSVEVATRRKPKKIHRQNSKEGVPNIGGFIHKPR